MDSLYDVSHHQATLGTHLQPLQPPLPHKLGAHNPQSKLALQIAPKWCQIQRLFLLTAYGNVPSPYQTVPSSTHSPEKGVVKMPSMSWVVGFLYLLVKYLVMCEVFPEIF